MFLPDLKTPLIWALGLGLAGALATAGVQSMRVSKANEKLATERLDRSKEDEARGRALIRWQEAQANKQLAHMAQQTEIADELVEQTKLRKVAEHRNAVLAGRHADLADRVRVAAEELSAAINSADGPGRAAAGIDSEHRPESLAGLVAEAGRLLAASGKLAAESREVIGRRDGEVAALKAVIENDRKLISTAGDKGSLMPESVTPATPVRTVTVK